MEANKTLNYDQLKQAELDGDFALQHTIARMQRRHDAWDYKPTFWERIYPKAEVKRLRAFIEAMRAEEHRAAKNALDLYAENESLRQYKKLADGDMYEFVTAADYNALKMKYEKTKEKLAGVSHALDEQLKDWNAYMIKDAP